MNRKLAKGLLLAVLTSGFLSASAYGQNQFIYTNNDFSDGNTVSGFRIAPNGALTPLPGFPLSTGGIGSLGGFFAINRATISLVNNFLFVTNSGSANISAFSINPVTGSLTLVPGSPFSTGGAGDISLASTPDGRFLIAASEDSFNATVFSIAANGALTPVPGSPFTIGGTTTGIKVTPNGKFLAAILVSHDQIAMFSIGVNGALTPVPGTPIFGSGPGIVAGLDINCAGTLMFVGEALDIGSAVNVFNIASDGTLTSVVGSPFILPFGDNSNFVTLSSDEKFLFVSNQVSDSITSLRVAPDGSLSPVGSSAFLTPLCSVHSMAVNRAGNLLYSLNECGEIFGFNVAIDGSLSPIAGSPIEGGGGSLPSIVAFPGKTCKPVFDRCLQSSNNEFIFEFNSTTGDYKLTKCNGFTLSGTGTVKIKGCTVTLQDTLPDHKVQAQIDTCQNKGTASIQISSSKTTVSIVDRNLSDNTCSCPL
jgi:6-phosphogluconolactonase (cycloisomerase 2 family)